VVDAEQGVQAPVFGCDVQAVDCDMEIHFSFSDQIRARLGSSAQAFEQKFGRWSDVNTTGESGHRTLSRSARHFAQRALAARRW
jgi:hypothetical protein